MNEKGTLPKKNKASERLDKLIFAFLILNGFQFMWDLFSFLRGTADFYHSENVHSMISSLGLSSLLVIGLLGDDKRLSDMPGQSKEIFRFVLLIIAVALLFVDCLLPVR